MASSNPSNSVPSSPSQHSRPSTRRNSVRRSSSRRSTARRSLLDLFPSSWGTETIPEGENEPPIHVDAVPPRIPSLDLPREEVTWQSQRSPTSVRSIIDPTANPENTVRAPSVRGVSRPGSRASSNSTSRSGGRGVAGSDSHNTQAFEQTSAVPRTSSDTSAHAGSASTAPDAIGHRHPADPLPERHPADHLPARSISEGSESSEASRGTRWRKRRPRRARQALPQHSLRRRLFPALRYASVRRKAFHGLVSGSMMLLILVVFLALMKVTNDFAQEFRILTVLFMLIFGVLFAHSMIRLTVLLLRLRRSGGLADPDFEDPESYAQVTEPIPVVLVRDEELGLSGSQSTQPDKVIAPPPPAYGRWRGSVRVDPNLIHWERVQTNQRPLSEGTIRRPPSYISEEGVEVQIEANPTIEALNEKPIRPRTPPADSNPSTRGQRRGPTVVYDATRSWVPQGPGNRS